MTKNPRVERLNNLFVDLFCKEGLKFALVDADSFQAFVHALNPHYKLPERHEPNWFQSNMKRSRRTSWNVLRLRRRVRLSRPTLGRRLTMMHTPASPFITLTPIGILLTDAWWYVTHRVATPPNSLQNMRPTFSASLGLSLTSRCILSRTTPHRSSLHWPNSWTMWCGARVLLTQCNLSLTGD